MPFVTIDGEDAKDFDDAVYAEKTTTGFKLYVAIADVAYYVSVDSDLDKEAEKRGNSVYLPNHVIPMLPEVLSNNFCSLRPEVNRLVVGCMMELDMNGKVIDASLHRAVIRSHARLTYNAVDGMLSKNTPIPDFFQASFQSLQSVAGLLQAERRRKGAITLMSRETKFIFDDVGELTDIITVARNKATELIEECMLCANVVVGRLLHEAGRPIIYRCHNQPDPEKVLQLQQYLKMHQIDFPDTPHASDFQAAIEGSKGLPDAEAVEMMVLRTLAQAYYSSGDAYHFALSFDHYTHFTSPIRRYVDLTVHRTIVAMLENKPVSEEGLSEIAKHCTQTERMADEATWYVHGWLKAKFIEPRVGEVFSAVITSITHFGMFVRIQTLPIEGLIHVSALGNEYFQYDSEAMSLHGQTTGRHYCLGDVVSVKLTGVDIVTQKVDFAITK